MGEVKTPWTDPVFGNLTDLSGALPTSRGSDPSIDLGAGGGSGLTSIPWASPVVPTPSGEETANSLSGLPLQPNRYQPSDTPPGPPNLTDRSPGTLKG